MQKLSFLGLLSSLVLTLVATSPQALAQQDGGGGGGRGGRGGGPGGGGFDPAAMRARMAERIREVLDIKSDDEWKVIEERVTKVNDARRNVGFGGGGRMMFGGGPGGRGGAPGGGGDQGGGRAGRGGFGGETMPEADALQKAIEAKASADEIKAKLAKYREARKAKQAALAKAQDDLRQVLSVRQEAAAVMLGLLD